MTDEEAIVRVLAGEVDAFAAIVHRYRDNYARFATRMLGSAADAEDVLQVAFLRAYQAIEQCREPARFGVWFYRIVVNECRAFASRRTRRDRWYAADDSALSAIAVDEPADGIDGPSLGEIQRALDQLPAEQREAFVLKHVEEVDYETMSELTGMGVSALKMRVKRACDRLRELLEEVHRD